MRPAAMYFAFAHFLPRNLPAINEAVSPASRGPVEHSQDRPLPRKKAGPKIRLGHTWKRPPPTTRPLSTKPQRLRPRPQTSKQSLLNREAPNENRYCGRLPTPPKASRFATWLFDSGTPAARASGHSASLPQKSQQSNTAKWTRRREWPARRRNLVEFEQGLKKCRKRRFSLDRLPRQ